MACRRRLLKKSALNYTGKDIYYKVFKAAGVPSHGKFEKSGEPPYFTSKRIRSIKNTRKKLSVPALLPCRHALLAEGPAMPLFTNKP